MEDFPVSHVSFPGGGGYILWLIGGLGPVVSWDPLMKRIGILRGIP